LIVGAFLAAHLAEHWPASGACVLLIDPAAEHRRQRF
jgi:hypothetical protein